MGAVVRTHTHTRTHALQPQSWTSITELGTKPPLSSLCSSQMPCGCLRGREETSLLRLEALSMVTAFMKGGGGSPTWIYLSNELENGEAFPLNSPRGMVVRGVCWDTQQSLHHHPPPPPHHQPAPAGGFPSSMFNLDQPRLSSLPRIRRSVSW